MHSWASTRHVWLRWSALAALFALLPARAQAQDDALQQQVRSFAAGSLVAEKGTRVAVEVGALDPRLRLAPCDEIQPYLPANARLWGRSRIGLRCVRGPSRWNVFLPVTVRVFAAALVATRALPAGSTLSETDLAQAEVDLAEDASNALFRSDQAVGRTLARPLPAGRSLRHSHLQPRQWFAAGETVQVIARGPGFRVTSQGQALTPGTEGQPVRIRTESGRILTAQAVGDRRVELNL